MPHNLHNINRTSHVCPSRLILYCLSFSLSRHSHSHCLLFWLVVILFACFHFVHRTHFLSLVSIYSFQMCRRLHFCRSRTQPVTCRRRISLSAKHFHFALLIIFYLFGLVSTLAIHLVLSICIIWIYSFHLPNTLHPQNWLATLPLG